MILRRKYSSIRAAACLLIALNLHLTCFKLKTNLRQTSKEKADQSIVAGVENFAPCIRFAPTQTTAISCCIVSVKSGSISIE